MPEDDEARYDTVRASRDVALLRQRLEDEEEMPLVRGAAARALCDLGHPEACWCLIANLHRAQRTYTTVDAIYHLEAVVGQTFGYDANLGYRHQTEKFAAWVDWFVTSYPQSRQGQTLQALAAKRDALPDLSPTPLSQLVDRTFEGTDEAALMAAWRWLAERAASRDPAVVATVAAGFQALLTLRPADPLLMNNYALASLNDGNVAQAEAYYVKALALTPDDPQLRNDLGILLEGLGRLSEAEAQYQRAEALRPDDDVAAANLADVLRKQGRSSAARAQYRRAEALAPQKWYYHRLWMERLR